MKLDQIFETWMNIDQIYEVKGSNQSKLEFLKKMLSSKAIMVARKAAMSDYVDNTENSEKLNFLFKTLEDASERLQTCMDEPKSLYDFVWGKKDSGMEIDIEHFSPFYSFVTADSESMINHGIYRNFYELRDGIVKHSISPNSEGCLIHFENGTDVIAWLYKNSKDVLTDKGFVSKVYAYVMSALKNKEILYPISFINKSDLLQGMMKNTKTLKGSYSTVMKEKFQCNTVARVYSVDGDICKDLVVCFE